jgi:hypothetical protein
MFAILTDITIKFEEEAQLRRPLLTPILIGTSYANCEVRQFSFTPDSNECESHLAEDESSKMARRDWGKKEETL